MNAGGWVCFRVWLLGVCLNGSRLSPPLQRKGLHETHASKPNMNTTREGSVEVESRGVVVVLPVGCVCLWLSSKVGLCGGKGETALREGESILFGRPPFLRPFSGQQRDAAPARALLHTAYT